MTLRTAGRRLVLLTGFGPFPGMPENASTRLAAELCDAAPRAFPSHAFAWSPVPTEWQRAPRHLHDLYRAHEPAAAIHFGVSGRASGFEIELCGRNRLSAIADAAGLVPLAGCLDPDGPDTLPSRLPVDRILQRLRAHGIPAALSRDAGGYLCNALLYHASAFGRRHDAGLRTGFIHLPAGLANLRQQPKRPPQRSRLTWAEALRGGLLIIGATLGVEPTAVR
ncbi:MAG: pyroglutamyl-peptidase I [Hyphomicrobiaceae bacterium]